MRFATICSGIGAPEQAMPDWECAFQSEIEEAPRAVLKYRYGAQDARHRRTAGPALWGDFTAIRIRHLRRLNINLPEWLVAGTPCQAFSIAGLRQSLDDSRGNLTLEFVRLVHALRRAGSLRGFTWENVPGVLSTADNAFGCFLAAVVGADTPLRSPLERGRWPDAGMVAGPWARVAWRILDAQHFGVPQRRRRVFVVADFGNGVDPAAVLFERHSLSGNPPPRRQAGERVAGTLKACAGKSGTPNGAEEADRLVFSGQSLSCNPDIAPCLDTGAEHHNRGLHVTHSLRAEGFDASEDGTGRGTPLVPVIADTLTSNGDAYSGYRDERGLVPVALMENQRAEIRLSSQTDALACGGGKPGQGYPATFSGSAVRRLTPRECERLQGFPDDFTLVPYRKGMMADGPRYKMLGNSMAVPVVRWIGERIAAVEALAAERLAA